MTAPLIGAVTLLAGAAATDVFAHAIGATGLESPAHVLTLVGMVATLVAVISGGMHRNRSAR